jgi:hypothetical protein
MVIVSVVTIQLFLLALGNDVQQSNYSGFQLCQVTHVKWQV